jgi:hypothetical protein
MRTIFHIAIVVFCVVTSFSASQSPAVTIASSSRVEIVGDKLFIAGIGHGFHVLDISNPVQPKWIGVWKNQTCPVGVQVIDNFAYLANRTSGFDVIDVHNPAAPAQVGHLSTGGDLQTVQVSGRYAYVSDWRRGLDIIDVSDPKQPKLAGDFETKGQGWSAVVVGDYAYASFGGGVLRTFHLENGSNPKQVDERQFAGGNALQIVDGTLFSGRFQSLCSIDIRNPASPSIIANSNARIDCQSIFISGPLAFATGSGAGLCVFDVSETGKIRQLGILEAGYQGFGVCVAGNYAYVVDGGSNLHVIDVSNPARPVEVNRVGTENFCSQVLSLTNFVAGKPVAEIQAAQGAITNAPPQLADATRTADGAFNFTLRGVPEGTYFIQASTDLISWTNISTNTLPAGGTLQISDPDAHLFNNRFYRAVKEQ